MWCFLPEFKVVILGDEAVGKTSLFYRYIHNKFENSYKQTLGTEILLKELSLNDEKVILQIWDVAGGSYFKRYREKYYNNATGALLVFDLTRRKTFDHLTQWLEEFETTLSKKPKYVLVGNKKDLQEQQTVGLQEINDFAEQMGFKLELTSAMTGENVESAFSHLAEMMYQG